MPSERTFRQVRHHDVERHVGLGWRVVAPEHASSHHDHWSVLMERSSAGLLLAIDPGLDGAWALLDGRQLLDAGDLPTSGDGTKRRIDAAAFAALVRDKAPDSALIEAAHSMPGQGVASTFRYGVAVGTIEGALLASGVALARVSAAKWKRDMGLIGKAAGGGEQARQRAIETWPERAALFSRRKDHHRAEAALIGLWSADR